MPVSCYDFYERKNSAYQCAVKASNDTYYCVNRMNSSIIWTWNYQRLKFFLIWGNYWHLVIILIIILNKKKIYRMDSTIKCIGNWHVIIQNLDLCDDAKAKKSWYHFYEQGVFGNIFHRGFSLQKTANLLVASLTFLPSGQTKTNVFLEFEIIPRCFPISMSNRPVIYIIMAMAEVWP